MLRPGFHGGRRESNETQAATHCACLDTPGRLRVAEIDSTPSPSADAGADLFARLTNLLLQNLLDPVPNIPIITHPIECDRSTARRRLVQSKTRCSFLSRRARLRNARLRKELQCGHPTKKYRQSHRAR